MDVSKKHKLECVDVNAHLHTPYSFSAFDKLTDALDRAVNENVKVVGINDFYSMDGYKSGTTGVFSASCSRCSTSSSSACKKKTRPPAYG